MVIISNDDIINIYHKKNDTYTNTERLHPLFLNLIHWIFQISHKDFALVHTMTCLDDRLWCTQQILVVALYKLIFRDHRGEKTFFISN